MYSYKILHKDHKASTRTLLPTVTTCNGDIRYEQMSHVH